MAPSPASGPPIPRKATRAISAESTRSDFNYDFRVRFTEEQQRSGVVEYNFRAMDTRSDLGDPLTLAV
jgi:predicted dithiol-disulfide oxidoreductase (DUF899 family)